MKEFCLLHETDPSLPIPRRDCSLFDDYESSIPLVCDVVDDAPLTDLEEVFDPPFLLRHLLLHSFLATS